MRHTTRDRNNRIRYRKIGNKLRQQAKQRKREARKAAASKSNA